MSLRYPAALALTLAVVLAAPGVAAKRIHRHPAHSAAPAPLVKHLYSARALGRARIVLQLKLFELREARLERARKAIERGLSVDRLLKTP